MKKIFNLLALSGVLFTSENVSAQEFVMKNSIDSFSYAAGVNIGKNMKSQGLDKVNGSMLLQGMQDVFNNQPTKMTEEMCNTTLQSTMQAYMNKKAAAAKEKQDAFFNENKMKKGVVALENGLQYEVLTPGDPSGMKPKPEDTVVVNYKGTLVDGTEFDNSFKRGQPAEFPLNGVIRGWTEILQLMTKGASWKVYIPSELGYGERGAGGAIPGNAILIFEINLIDIKPAATK